MASTRCYHPVHGFKALGGGISFDAHKSTGIPTSVPCGRCLGCRLEHSRQWAVRMTHEAQMNEFNSFLTLTYNDDALPADGSTDKAHFQSFIRRLRKSVYPTRIRFFHCGEYGTDNHRPHYHAALFGYSFPDRKQWSVRRGNPVWTSDHLDKMWGHGFAEIGDLTFKSAAYIARYTTAKRNITKYTPQHEVEAYYTRYERVSPITGEVHLVNPEYATMSLKPGIGESWFRKFKTDVYPSDEIIVNGKPQRPPRYYDRLLMRADPIMWETVRRARSISRDRENSTPDRLRASEICKTAEVSLHQTRN